jgi:hypothetical protein
VIRPSICQSLSNDTFCENFSARHILKANCGAVRITEIEFRNVAMQMLLAAMLISALHPTLKNRVVSFDRVCIHVYAGFSVDLSVLIARMVYGVVLGKVLAELTVNATFVSYYLCLFGDVRLNDRDNVLFLGAIDMERANLAAALNKGQDSVLVARSATHLSSLSPSDVGSSISTIEPAPPIGAKPPVRIASRKRWHMNHVDL